MRPNRLVAVFWVLAAASVAASPVPPLPGLDDVQLARFVDAGLLFRSQFSPDEGLGPGFNGRSCYSCHRRPSLGGHSTKMVVRFGRDDGDGFDPLVAQGGPLLQSKGLGGSCTEAVPAGAFTVKRNTVSMLGDGLIEAIPDQQIIDRAAAELAENPAAAGRPHLVTGVVDGLTHVGRFGWKGNRALLADIVAEALVNEIGITNALFPTENAPGGDAAVLAGCDRVPEPEDTTDIVNRLTFLVRYLAPAPPRKANDDIAQGKALFEAIGCPFCHYAGYTSASTDPVLDAQSVPIYSDLLLHDIGTGDGIVQDDAQGNEFRTAPLWITRGGQPYLHDGRAVTLTDAILAHGNQAIDSRNAFAALSAIEQRTILRFLLR
jgi:CxxC motif-containing protein (DUF1111 family)